MQSQCILDKYLPNILNTKRKISWWEGRGSLFNIWRVLDTNYILQYWRRKFTLNWLQWKYDYIFWKLYQKSFAEIANFKIWLWLGQFVGGTFCEDRISFLSKKSQNWIGKQKCRPGYWTDQVDLNLIFKTRQIFFGILL